MNQQMPANELPAELKKNVFLTTRQRLQLGPRRSMCR